jgi:hypothetical protein
MIRVQQVLVGLALTFTLTATTASAQTVAIDNDDIAGVVTGPSGPEAGVWVIAETSDLPTKFARIVVTDDRGRFLVPDLPAANYSVWVRGYGLVDSPKQRSKPGQRLNLIAVPAPNARAAAEYYPAGWWYALLQVPSKEEFADRAKSGFSDNVQGQADFIRRIKSGACTGCHQLGNKATREIPAALGEFPKSVDAWHRRLQSGQAGGAMLGMLSQTGQRAFDVLADWTDRIKAGEFPPTPPPRPQGVERNVVITQWDWADPKVYLHDLVSTDRRKPTVNAKGPLYGALEASGDYIPVLDPVRHTASRIPLTVRDEATQPAAPPAVVQSSAYFGNEAIWTSRNNVHNPMLDERGRLWITSAVRPPANPAFCKQGSSHPSAQLTPVENAQRHLQMYDPKTKKLTHISTCFSTHHLMFAEDANNTLWTSGGGPVVGWLNTKLFDETGDEEKSQGWTALILDTNGNGKRDEYVQGNQPVDPTKDKRIMNGLYAVAPAPDGSVWGTSLGYPGALIRITPGANPPHTTLAEIFQPPMRDGEPVAGFSPRGGDIDRNGVAWIAMASGHMASFDRRKCKVLNGPTATGQHCPEGWSFFKEPVPQMKGAPENGSAEGSYYTWVDQFNTFGLGANVPINTGNAAEGLLVRKDNEWIVLRVPYPLGFYTKWLDGRIDDPRAGWKGRGLWATIGTRAPFHMEGGKGMTSKVMQFQLRPNPLAK